MKLDTAPLADGLLEAVIADFRAVFPRQTVDSGSDFFELGGDSLNAETLAMQLGKTAGRDIQISALFDFPTPAQMAAHLIGGAAAVASSTERPPIFLVHGNSGYTVPKKAFFDGLAPGQRLELFQLPGINSGEPIPLTTRDMARIYVERLQEVLPEGPVLLGGFCNGSLIAVEMAHLLRAAGRSVARLILLDPQLPNSIERIVSGRPARLVDRVGLFFLTGRTTGGASLRDVEDMRLLRIRRHLFSVEIAFKHVRSRLTGHKQHRLRRNVRGAAALRAAFVHAWPDPYDGPTDIVCARTRVERYSSGGTFWQRVVPDATILPILDRHEEVTGANGPEVAALMQARFDEAVASSE